MKPTISLSALALSGFALAASPAVAQVTTAEGFALNRYNPSEQGSDWFSADSIDMRGHGRWAVGLLMDYAHNPLVVKDDAGNTVSTPVSNQMYQHLGGAVTLWDRLRIGASLPIAVIDTGGEGTVGNMRYQLTEGAALGDARVGADVHLLGAHRSPIRLAVGVQMMVPTGSRGSYTGDGKVRILPRVLGAGDVGMFSYAAQLAFDGRFLDGDVSGHPLGTAAHFAAAGGVRLVRGALIIGPEVHGSTSLKDDSFFKGSATAVEALLGGHYAVDKFWRVGVGGGRDFTSALGSPSFRLLAMVSYALPFEAAPPPPPPARIEVAAAPPPAPPPPPPDADKDGIADASDACPELAGVPSADAAKNGCPIPPDGDKDGIADADDACPMEFGPTSSERAKNGCPIPPDGDKDGIADADDACPDVPGDPDPNNRAKNGCPKVRVVAGEIQILERIEFDNAKFDIRGDAEPTLAAVARVLGEHKEIKKVRVEGYTDSRGNAKKNKKLSQDRVDSVVKWLSAHGIEGDRLVAQGFGKDNPVADNKTEAGRQKNRRVQFIILEKSEGQAEAPPVSVAP